MKVRTVIPNLRLIFGGLILSVLLFAGNCSQSDTTAQLRRNAAQIAELQQQLSKLEGAYDSLAESASRLSKLVEVLSSDSTPGGKASRSRQQD